MVGWQIWQVSNHKQANKKIGISNNAREKTQKHNEETLKAKKKSRKLVNFLYKSRVEVIMDDEKYFCFDDDNMLAITRMTKKNVHTMFALLEKKNILRKS